MTMKAPVAPLTAMTVNSPYPLPVQYYTTGSGTMVIAPPTYTYTPVYATKTITQTKTVGPSGNWCTFDPTIGISVSTTANVGSYTVSIKTLDSNTGIFDVQTFTLIVRCLSSITVGAVTNVSYSIGTVKQTRVPVSTLSPSTCSATLTYTVK